MSKCESCGGCSGGCGGCSGCGLELELTEEEICADWASAPFCL